MIERIKAKLLPLVASFAWLPLLAFLLFATSGSFLVVNRPEKADLLVVLAGGTEKGYTISVAASSNNREFGTAWWKHRQWAKNNLGEWLRLVRWELVERWIR